MQKYSDLSHLLDTWKLKLIDAQKPMGTTLNGKPSMTLQIRHFEVFGGRTRLAMPKTISAPDTSSLKLGSGATEGVLD